MNLCRARASNTGMARPLLVLAAALAAAAAVCAQAPPIAVPPVRIGPPGDTGWAVDRPGMREPVPPATAPPRVAPPPPAPAPVGNCNAGGCWDSQGNRYDSAGGNGSRLISPDGRLCQTRGQFIHCN